MKETSALGGSRYQRRISEPANVSRETSPCFPCLPASQAAMFHVKHSNPHINVSRETFPPERAGEQRFRKAD